MNKNRREDEIWHYKQQTKFLAPDFTPVMAGGREWHRDHPLPCPVCGVMFFGYQPVGAPFEPYRNSPLDECRQTCGHPKCWGTEVDRHQKANGDYAANVERFYNRKQEVEKEQTSLDHI